MYAELILPIIFTFFYIVVILLNEKVFRQWNEFLRRAPTSLGRWSTLLSLGTEEFQRSLCLLFHRILGHRADPNVRQFFVCVRRRPLDPADCLQRLAEPIPRAAEAPRGHLPRPRLRPRIVFFVCLFINISLNFQFYFRYCDNFLEVRPRSLWLLLPLLVSLQVSRSLPS